MATLKSHTLAAWSPPLLGRDVALAQLRAARSAAMSGRGGIAWVEAAAGLGKTRLVYHTRRSAAQTDMQVLAARATQLERDFPFGIARQLLDPALDRAGPTGRDALLAGSAAAARPALCAEGRQVDASGVDAQAVLYGLYQLVLRLADRPLLVAVDDAHLADEPSLRFLAFLAPRLDQLPVLLVVATRPPEGDPAPALAQLAADPGMVRVSLDPLDPAAVSELVASAFSEPADPRFSDACHEITGGNPFLVAELARALLAADVRPIASEAETVRTILPDDVAHSVRTRLAGASTAARGLAQAVAILGDGQEPYLAAQLAGLAADQAPDAADELRRAGILAPDTAPRFAHPLIGQAVYLDRPAGARAREHRRAADMLAGLDFPPDRVATQLLATDPDGRSATATLAAAARVALARGAPRPAATYLKRALRERLDRPSRLDVIELLVRAAVRVPDISLLDPHDDELQASLAREPERLRRVAIDYATALIGRGHHDEALALLERAADAAETAGDLHAAVTLDAQMIAYRQDPPDRASARLARYDRRAPANTPAGRLLLGLRAGWASQLGRPAVEAATLAHKALASGLIFDESPDAPASTQAILVLARADELDVAERAADQMIASANRRASLVGLTSGWFARACARRRRGDLPGAETDIRKAVDAARLAGFLQALPPMVAAFVDILTELDQLDEADAALAEAALDSPDLPPGFWFDTALYSRGRLRLAQDRPQDAANDLVALRSRVVHGTRDIAGLPAGSQAALALARLGKHERALTLAQEELDTLRQWGAPSAVAEGLTALGQVSTGHDALAALDEAVALSAPSPARLTDAEALVERGAHLTTNDDRDRGISQLEDGLALAHRCGATALARRAARHLAAAGQPARDLGPTNGTPLTPAERRVADLAARAMTNREIAHALNISIKTVESHLRATYRKLGIRSRHGLTDATR